MQSSVSFPRTRQNSIRDNASWISGREPRISTTNREIALEVHDLVYGAPPAMTSRDTILSNLERLYEPNAVYENPLITATSRDMILDIHNLTRRVADVEVARPRALLSWLFGWGNQRNEPPWFEALKCWSEIGDIVAESESWDGTRRSVIEHTLHILLLPGLHVPASSMPARQAVSPSASSLDLVTQQQSSSTSILHNLAHPVLAFRGLGLPSPFHLQLRIITKLTFNEQGRVSAHRDFWDIRDLAGLVPGVPAAQYVLTRLAARTLAVANWFFSRSKPTGVTAGAPGAVNDDTLNALGLLGLRPKRSQAPDTDPDAMIGS